MGLIQWGWPVPSHPGRLGAAHEDGHRHVSDVELNILPPAVDARVDPVPKPESDTIEMGPQSVQLGEPQEEGAESPCRATGASGDLEVGTFEVDPAVALERLRAHRHSQPEPFVQPGDRVGEGGNLD
jgi:hypothetical protein